MTEVHVDDYGWMLSLSIRDDDGSLMDISYADLVEIIFTKPNNTGNIVRTAQFINDGTDGAIYYVIEEGDIDETGTWQIQVQIKGSTSELRSNIDKLKVYRNL